MVNLTQFTKDALLGGASYNINTGEYNPTKGYFVSVMGCEDKSESLNKDLIKTYVYKHLDVLANTDKFLGAWLNEDDGLYYLDCSEQIHDLRTALVQGMRRDQKAIWDANNSREIRLPTRQRAGTSAQCEAYLQMKVNELIEQYA